MDGPDSACTSQERTTADGRDRPAWYNKFYIGLTEDGRANNFVTFRARKQFVSVETKVNDLEGWTQRLEEAGLDLLPADTPHSLVRFRLTGKDMTRHRTYRGLHRAAGNRV